MLNRWLSGVVVTLTVLLSGCSTVDEPEWKQLPEAVKTLRAEDSNQTVQVRVGEYVKISLKANPSTGYTWFFRIDGADVAQGKHVAVELVGERLIMPELENPDTRRVGAPGVKEVMVRAVEPGLAHVVGECRRPWSKETALTVKYRIMVIR